MPIGFLLLLILATATIILSFRLSTTVAGHTGRLSKYKRLVRWLCGTAGLLLFAAVGFGTMFHLHDVYRTEASADSTKLIPAPTKPRVTPLFKNNDYRETPFEGRFLLQSFFVSNGGRILHAETQDLTWPQAMGKKIETKFNVNGTEVHYEKTLNEARWTKSDSTIIAFVGGNFLANSGFSASGSYQCDEDGDIFPSIHFPFPGSFWGKPFSLNIINRLDTIAIFNVIVLIQKDDPLTMQPAYRFLNDRIARQQMRNISLVERDNYSRSQNAYSAWTTTPRLVFLIARMGMALLILLIGALLVAQIFRNKAVSSAVAIFLAMLYVVALDRIVLDRHLQILSDAGQPNSMREFACLNAASTFFHHTKTEDLYNRLMLDKATSLELRQTIQRAAQMFQEPKLYDTSRLPSESILSILLNNGTPRNEATLAELQKNNPLCIWFRQDRVIVSLPAGGNTNGGQRGGSLSETENRGYLPASWPDNVIYRRLRQEADNTVSVEFSLADPISKDLGLEKGKIWSALFTKEEIFEGFGLSRPPLFPQEYSQPKEKFHPRQRILLAHAGVILK
jgi:hypothetical protein